MKILTDGTSLLHATSHVCEHGGERDRYEPVSLRLAPGQGTQWWGSFPRGARLQLEVAAGTGADLEIEVLDSEFRLRARAKLEGATWSASADLDRDGLAYVRVRNLTSREQEACLILSIETESPSTERASSTSLVQRLIGALQVAAASL